MLSETVLSADALVKTSMKVSASLNATTTYVAQPGPLLTYHQRALGPVDQK